jgi:uncharacterized protein YkwD
MKNLILFVFVFVSFQTAISQNDTNVVMDQSSSEDIQNEIISTGSKVTPSEAMEFLNHHNMARNELGVSNLVWNATIASAAQSYAESLASRNCAFEHSRNPLYGENSFMGNGRVYTALDGSKSWYKEKANYTYNNSSYNHYTQMIWKNTTEVGVGVAMCSDGSYIIIANYASPGNFSGEYPY